MTAKVSFIIPTFRRFEMLKSAIASILAQDYPCCEIIVIDDNSEDNTSSISQVFPQITFLQNSSNYGPGYSRKIGFGASTGEYIVFLDDDDFYTDPHFLSETVELLQAHPEYLFVSANANILNVDTGIQNRFNLNVLGEMDAAEYLQGFPDQYKKPPSTFLTVFRRSCLIQSNIDSMEMVNDMPIYMRVLALSGKIYFLDKVCGTYRVHNSNISKSLSVEFIISNLVEKYKVYEMIKARALFEEYDQWWLRQIIVTTDYFAQDSNPRMSDLLTLQKWCFAHSNNDSIIRERFKRYRAHLISSRTHAIKSTIKNILRF